MQLRLAVMVMVGACLCRIASAEPAHDTLGVTGEVLGGPVVWLGGSVNYEHRFANSSVGLVLRGGAAPGAIIGADEGAEFTRFKATAGVRYHWALSYIGAEAGWVGIRDPRVVGPDDEHYGIEWHSIPDLEVEVGLRLGSVEVGAFAAPIGVGIRLGAGFDL